MVETADEFGLRLFYAPIASGGRYVFDEAGVPRRHWDEKSGLAALDAAGEWIARHRGSRVEGMVVLDEFHVSTPSLRRRAFDIAEQLGVGFTLHFCEQVVEFQDCVRETGRTPVELLAEEGVLAPRTLLAHCLYIAGHRAVAYPYGNDRAILARSGASVAHSPAGLARRGVALETFQSFRDAGVRLALGTDTFPLDLFAEMRSASSVSRLLEQNHESADAMAVFVAATTGGADALRRPDLGRIKVGAKADLVLVDFDNLEIGPYRDPIRMLVHVANSDMVDTVFIDGRKLVEGGRLLVCDEREVVAAARRSADAVWDAFPDYHRTGRSVDEEFPPAIRKWGDD
jgi:cytosine/adenosine deaminase-related metal-dependent hydrolase